VLKSINQIEETLAGAAGIRFALSTVHPESQLLIALLVPEALDVDESAIIAIARARAEHLLPQHMRPSSYVVSKSLPRSPNGKTNRRAVPAIYDGKAREPQIALSSASDDTVDADIDTAVLTDVREAIAETTGIPISDIHAKSNLYTLGVDSLSGIRLLQRLRARGRQGLTIAGVVSAGEAS
jgi:ferricrocin synthase